MSDKESSDFTSYNANSNIQRNNQTGNKGVSGKSVHKGSENLYSNQTSRFLHGENSLSPIKKTTNKLKIMGTRLM